MLNNYLALYKLIKSVITISDNKAFKSKKLLLNNKELKYIKNCLSILGIFVKATNKLQGDLYPTIYYTIPLIYQVYNKLEEEKLRFQVSNSLTYKYY
jgi:hypothetical protein